jgi:23S rRNA maturation-related 3'-5' exoribonuclease YhaM
MANIEVRVVEQIGKNWELFVSLVKKIENKDVRESLLGLCDEIGTRMAACPASSATKFVGAFPGGLTWHSLEVLKVMKELNKIYDAGLSDDSLIVTALFHDVGKIGNKTEDLYLPQESDWHVKRGMMFVLNENVSNIPVCIRSLWWLSTGVSLSEEEIHAISSLQHMGQMYSSELYNAPMLTMILQQAVRAACTKNKGRTSVLNA